MTDAKLRIRKAWDCLFDLSDFEEGPFIVHAPTEDAARILAYQELSEHMDDESGPSDIYVRRARYADLEFPQRHPILDTLSPRQTQMVGNAYGIHSERPGYREGYCTRESNEEMASLVILGLFGLAEDSASSNGQSFFFLTSFGKDVARSLVPTYLGERP